MITIYTKLAHQKMNWELCRDDETAIAYQVKHIYETGEDIPEVKSNLHLTSLKYGFDVKVIYHLLFQLSFIQIETHS